MSNDRYTVLLKFDPGNFEIRTKVHHCLTRLKSVDPAQLETILSKGDMVVKRDTDLKTAELIVQLFQGTGAKCRIRNETTQEETEVASMEAPSPPISRNSHMVCPQCGQTQPLSQECRACGVIIVKAKNAQLRREGIEKTVPQAKEISAFSEAWMMLGVLIKSVLPYVLKWLWVPFKIVDIRRWPQRIRSALFRCCLNFIIACGLVYGFDTLSQYAWMVYKHTPVGQYYVTHFITETESFNRVFSLDPLHMGWQVTLFALIICTALGFITQFLHLIRYLYESRGILGKLLLWFCPMTALAAWLLSRYWEWLSYDMACVLVFIPVLLQLPGCLYLARLIIPELGDMAGVLVNHFRIIYRYGENKIFFLLGIQPRNEPDPDMEIDHVNMEDDS